MGLEPLEDRRLLSLAPLSPIWLTELDAEGQADFLTGKSRPEAIEETSEGISGEISLPGVVLQSVPFESWDFTRISVPGWGYDGNMGQAALPALHRSFVIPNGMEAVPQYTIHKSVVLPDSYLVYPVQASPDETDDGSTSLEQFRFDQSYYSGSTITTSVLEVSRPMSVRDTRCIFIEISPFSYDPASGHITVATDFSFSVRFQPQTALTDSAAIANGAMTLEIPTDVLPDPTPEAQTADYLIIAASGLYSAGDPDDPLNRLAEWKRKKGFQPYILELPEVTELGQLPSFEEIDQYIYETYTQGQHKLAFVLLAPNGFWGLNR